MRHSAHTEENILSVATNTETVSDPGPFNLKKWQIKTACSVDGPGILNLWYGALVAGFIWDFQAIYKPDWEALVTGVSGNVAFKILSTT